MPIAYHESGLSQETQEIHRAVSSLVEELEAVDWYNQRADVTQEPSLKEVLAHNRDEEIEHAAMLLEWLRRRMPKIDEKLRIYLFTEGSIAAIEAAAEGGEGSPENVGRGAKAPERAGDLGLGNLKKRG